MMMMMMVMVMVLMIRTTAKTTVTNTSVSHDDDSVDLLFSKAQQAQIMLLWLKPSDHNRTVQKPGDAQSAHFAVQWPPHWQVFLASLWLIAALL